MKKKDLCASGRLFACIAISTVMLSVRAQVSNPSTWSGFVKGSGNTLVVDTFRMQTFSGAVCDNWNYTLDGGAAVEQESNKLKIPLKGSVSFESYLLESTQRVSAVITLSAHLLTAGDTLFVELDNKNGKNRGGAVYPQRKDKFPKSVEFGSNPCRLDFSASTLNNNTNGYFLIDSIYAYDTIPKHSLFTGAGNWNDKSCWSHLPPFRHRRALINGDLEVNSLVQCNQASLADGSLRITDNGHFIVDELFLHNNDISLTVAGELTINKQITTYYTFPEKGKWYFLSFPFDIPLKGIDSRFQLKDDTFSGSGDYLYVQTYNGDKRASSQKPTGNWEVFPEPESSDNSFIFEKGKGYLIALDAAASDNRLTFSVEKENIPAGFGKTASIPVEILSGNAGNDHGGWYLCGNPLPAPLKLSQIDPDPALDGNIYLYDGKNYKPYAIGSNYALPPLAAFFVKATTSTELAVTNEPPAVNSLLLKSDIPLNTELTEPVDIATQLSLVRKKNGESLLKGNTLYLNDLPSAGNVTVMDVAGRIVYSCFVPNCSSVLSLSLRSGLYIVIVDAGGYRAQHKCVLTQ